MQTCPHCKQRILTTDTVCPYCQKPIPATDPRKKNINALIIAGVLIAVLLLVLAYWK
jgi:uncharacterized integral membrane protein